VSAYIYKRRTAGMGARNPFRPRGQIKYDPWKTVARFDTLDAARSYQNADCIGLYDRAIFYRGQRITDSGGRLTRAAVLP
jgi:hypothetical protein